MLYLNDCLFSPVLHFGGDIFVIPFNFKDQTPGMIVYGSTLLFFDRSQNFEVGYVVILLSCLWQQEAMVTAASTVPDLPTPV